MPDDTDCARGKIWVDTHGDHYELRIVQMVGERAGASLCLSGAELKSVAAMLEDALPHRHERDFPGPRAKEPTMPIEPTSESAELA